MDLMDRRNFGWFARGALATVVFLCAVEAFRSGVDVSARAGVPQMGLLTQLYYSAGLFVLGGMDLGTPVGGSTLARALLWGSYFCAPLITTSTLIEGVRRVGYGAVERFGMRQHLVVAGLGRLGMTFVTACRQRSPKGMIVAVDRDVNRAAVTQARRQLRVYVLPGDIQFESAFLHLALDRARGVALLTDDDLLNLEVAFRLAKSHPRLSIVAHCSDLALERSIADTWGETRERIHVFNSQRAAAQHLYYRHLQGRFRGTAGKDTVILAGFGRFAQTLLEFLAQHSADEIERILIAAPTARLGLRKFHSHVQTASLSAIKTFDGELSDPLTWDLLEQDLGAASAALSVIIGSDDESANVQSAILVRRRWPDSHVFVRCQSKSSFADELAKRHGFILLSVDGLVLEALYAAQMKWFAKLELSGVDSVRATLGKIRRPSEPIPKVTLEG
jgi:voltage-gated potassium channel Kch